MGLKPSAMLLGAAVLGLGVATSALAANWGRDALRSVVAACAVAKSAVGVAFPCSDVHFASPGADGYALIRSPGFASEFLVSPLGAVDGIESPELQNDSATALWNAAWAARTDVAAALDRKLPRNAVGLAVNAIGTRTQDHFHIHIDCVRQNVARALDARAASLGTDWQVLPVRFGGVSYWVRSIRGQDLRGENIVRLMANSPPAASTSLDHATVGVVPATLSDGTPGFYVLANWSDASAEQLLDHQCRGR